MIFIKVKTKYPKIHDEHLKLFKKKKMEFCKLFYRYSCPHMKCNIYSYRVREIPILFSEAFSCIFLNWYAYVLILYMKIPPWIFICLIFTFYGAFEPMIK